MAAVVSIVSRMGLRFYEHQAITCKGKIGSFRSHGVAVLDRLATLINDESHYTNDAVVPTAAIGFQTVWNFRSSFSQNLRILILV